MSAQVSLETVKVIFTEGKEEVRKTMKEEAQAALEKSSAEAKEKMKKYIDHSAKSTATATNYASKVGLNMVGPPSVVTPVACCLDHAVQPTTEVIVQKIGYKSVDKCVDTVAKKAIDHTVDKAMDTSGSCLCNCFQYITNLFSRTDTHEKTN